MHPSAEDEATGFKILINNALIFRKQTKRPNLKQIVSKFLRLNAKRIQNAIANDKPDVTLMRPHDRNHPALSLSEFEKEVIGRHAVFGKLLRTRYQPGTFSEYKLIFDYAGGGDESLEEEEEEEEAIEPDDDLSL